MGRARRRRHGASRSRRARPARRAGIERGDVLLAVNGAPVETPADVVEYQHRGREGTRLAYTLAAARHAAGARGLAGAGAARPRRCISCWRRSGSSRCWSARRCGCGGRAIRRRCISSGCASRSSARSRSRSTVRSIGSTGSSTGATRSRWRCCRRCCCISRWCFPSVRRGAPRSGAVAAAAAHVPAGAGARRRRASSSIARGARGRRAVLARARPARSRRAGLSVPLRASAAVVVLVRAFGEITSLTGAPAAALDRVGHGARRRPVRVRLRAAVGARRRSAARAAADGDSARPRAADLRVGDRALPAARRRSHHQARRSPTRRFSRASVALYLAMLQARRLRRSPTTPTRTTGSSRCWRRSSSCCSRSR